MKYLFTFLLSAVLFFGCKSKTPQETGNKLEVKMPNKTIVINLDDTLKSNKTYQAEINTNQGTFTLDLYSKQTPKTVANFVLLAKSGYYDGLTFHRIIKDFMIQGGDPAGNGGGGTSIYGEKFDDEILPEFNFKEPGVLAMANSGANTNASQFFITVSDQSRLDGKYTIFGKVTNNYDVVKKISMVPTISNKEVKDRPTMPVIINSIKIIEK